MKEKKLYIIILSAMTLILSAAAFMLSFKLNTKSIARENLKIEISDLQAASSDMKNDKADISNSINNLDADLNTKDTINQYYIEYKKTNDELKSTIEDLNSQSAALDESIKNKKQELVASDIKTETKGKSYTLNSNGIYTCPDKLPEGRYIASGSGSIIIYASNGSPRVNENLDVAYDNSYTFDLKNNEQIRVTDSVTVTELK